MKIETRADFGKLLEARGMLGNAAEIGVAEGRYSRDILSWGVSKLYMVDVWRRTPELPGDCNREDEWHESNYRACMELAGEYRGQAIVLRGLSSEAATQVPDDSLTFVHLDATHEYESVKQDLETWWPKLIAGGVFSGHDYLSPQYTVGKAADEFAALHGLKLHCIDEKRINDACFWFEKK